VSLCQRPAACAAPLHSPLGFQEQSASAQKQADGHAEMGFPESGLWGTQQKGMGGFCAWWWRPSIFSAKDPPPRGVGATSIKRFSMDGLGSPSRLFTQRFDAGEDGVERSILEDDNRWSRRGFAHGETRTIIGQWDEPSWRAHGCWCHGIGQRGPCIRRGGRGE